MTVEYCSIGLFLRRVVSSVLLILLVAIARSQSEESDGFQAGIYKDGHGRTMPNRLFRPAGYESGSRYPLVLFLHGFEALGRDNKKQISGMDYAGSHIWANSLSQAAFPCFVLAPQCPKGSFWANPVTRNPTKSLRLVVDMLDSLIRQYPIDPDRIYVTGQSLGGFGTWALIGNYPNRFAAAIPVCGGGRTGKARALAKVPVWAFHGSADPFVPVFELRRMIHAIRKAGGDPRYTEYKHMLHNVWNLAYADPEMISWLFQQRRHADVPKDGAPK